MKHSLKGLVALGGVLLLLAGCGGGGDSGDSADGVVAAAESPTTAPAIDTAAPRTEAPTSGLPAAPATPQGLAVTYQARTYAFQWSASANATHYELLEDPDGAGPQPPAQVGGVLAGTSYALAHKLILHQRIGAEYRLRACNDVGCSAYGNPLQPDVAKAVGYFKAANTGAGDAFGGAVALSLDGSTLVVGAPGEDSNATYLGGNPADDSAPDAGAVYVFRRAAQGWEQQAYLKGEGVAGDHFGTSLAVSADGTRIAVGAPGANGGRGKVAFYERGTDAIWWRSSIFGGADFGDALGSSVSLSADGLTLAIGAPEEDSGIVGSEMDNSRASAGTVYVWRRTSPTGWMRIGLLQAAVPWAGNRFGAVLALSGDGGTLAVGAPGDACPCPGIDAFHAGTTAAGSGAVYVFARALSSWTRQAYVKAGNASTGAGFGSALSLSADGNTLAVGAPYESSNATGINGTPTVYYTGSTVLGNSGAAYVFERSGTAWSQQAFVKGNYYTEKDLFGSSVALSSNGNMLAVGVPKDSSWASGFGGTQIQEGGEAGAVHLLGRTGGGWSLVSYVKPTNNKAILGSWFLFGQSVALAADGSAMAVGAPQESGGATGIQGEQDPPLAATGAGAVYLY